MLSTDQAMLVVVDMQVKLLPAIWEQDRVVRECCRMVEAAKALDVPVLWAEQNPAGLGPTHPSLASLLKGPPIAKTTFSCYADSAFREAMERLGRRQVILCGIEAHVCVAQTALDLLQHGMEVHVAADAVSSRTPENRRIALDRLRAAGAVVSSVEMAIFELLRRADHTRFKQVLGLVK
jgi:nicotinamidase-related amidase